MDTLSHTTTGDSVSLTEEHIYEAIQALKQLDAIPRLIKIESQYNWSLIIKECTDARALHHFIYSGIPVITNTETPPRIARCFLLMVHIKIFHYLTLSNLTLNYEKDSYYRWARLHLQSRY